jgi:3-hydroxyisobutyrate dehydrogenase
MENRWETMTNNEFDYGFAVDWMRKDLAICLNEARQNGASLPVTSLIEQFYSEIQRAGGNRWDSSSLITLLERA